MHFDKRVTRLMSKCKMSDTAMQNPDVAKALGPSTQRDAAMAKRQQEWIAARGKP